jgi:mono/diheme cytochrome c family protein
MTRHRDAALVLMAAIAASASLAGATTLMVRSAPSPTLSLGGDIFSRGIDPSGQPTAHAGGVLGLFVDGCASCHGSKGHGPRSLVRITPNITYANLTDPRGILQPDGRRGPSFTDQTIRRAITAGVDPRGAILATTMPRWQLNDREWAGLLTYLKILK